MSQGVSHKSPESFNYNHNSEKDRLNLFYTLLVWGEKIRKALFEFSISKWEAIMGLSVLRTVAQRVAPDDNYRIVADQQLGEENLDILV